MFVRIQNRDKTGLTFGTAPNGTGITLYNASGAVITKGDVFMIEYVSTAGREYSTKACATNSVVGKDRYAVALEDIPAAKIGYFAVEGYVALVLVLGHASLVIGSRLKGVNAAKYLTFDHATIGTAKCCAIALEAGVAVTQVLRPVLMLDNRAVTL